MNLIEMPRRQKMFRLDDRIIKALGNIAREGKVNAFVEGLLFEFLQRAGQIPNDATPYQLGYFILSAFHYCLQVCRLHFILVG